MYMKKYLVSAVLLFGALGAVAQDKSNSCGDNTPEKGDITAALTLGYNNYAGISAQAGNQLQYEATLPTNTWTEKHVSLGIEGGWFFCDLWKLGFGGGINFLRNPGKEVVYGTVDYSQSIEDNMGNIPDYLAVPDTYGFSYYVNLGVDRYFKLKKAPNLMPYVGIHVGYTYAFSEKKADDYTWMGISGAETWNLNASIACGADYYFLPNMFVGIALEPFQYVHSLVSYRPQVGLRSLKAHGNNFNVLANPTLKVGFKF